MPTPEAEDARQLNRELMSLRHERTRLTIRLHGLLAGQGVSMEVGSDFPEQLDPVALWDGSPLPPRLHGRLLREWVRLGLLCRQIRGLEKERRLLALRAIGINSAWLFVMEFFGWREFRNRRQVIALDGLVATPYSSGESERELGISKGRQPAYPCTRDRDCLVLAPLSAAERTRAEVPGSVRTRQQTDSQDRDRGRGPAALIELWRYLETGRPPEGRVAQGVRSVQEKSAEEARA